MGRTCRNDLCRNRLPGPARFCPRCGTRRRRRRGLPRAVILATVAAGIFTVLGLRADRHTRTGGSSPTVVTDEPARFVRTRPDFGHSNTVQPRYPEHADWPAADRR